MSAFYSPLRYPGGKNCIYPFMKSLIEENGLEGCSYAEPFAGGAGLALHLLIEGVVSEVYLNDFDHSIYAFWHTILNETDIFCNWISTVEICMETWKWAKNIHLNMQNFSDMEVAKATFYLNRTNVSGIITGGPIGGPMQTGKFKIDARFNKMDLIERIKRIAAYKRKIHLFEMNGTDFIKILNRKRKTLFIYIDPPYVNKGADLYMNFFDTKQHQLLCSQISHLRKPWLASYDNQELIRNLYERYNQVCYSLSQCTSNRMGNEIIIFPNDISLGSALYRLKNPVFIQRKDNNV